jgi:hypothetical protein
MVKLQSTVSAVKVCVTIVRTNSLPFYLISRHHCLQRLERRAISERDKMIALLSTDGPHIAIYLHILDSVTWLEIE